MRHKPVHCTLNTFPLDELPDYEALSHFWGSPRDGHHIFIDQSPFAVPQNLGNALKRMRNKVQDRWIWVDAICMDETEWKAQYFMVRTIFSEASQVIVWLGEPSQADLPAIATLDHLEFLDMYKIHSEMDQRLLPAKILPERSEWLPDLLKQTELFTRNLDRLWFTSVWNLRDYVLAKRVVFQWGSKILDSIALTDNVNCIVNVCSSLMRVAQQEEEIRTIMSRLRGFRYFSWAKRTWDRNPEDPAAFAYIVATAQELGAPRQGHKVYGLLALAPSSVRDSYRPSYTSTVDDIYLDLAVAMSLTRRVEAAVDLIEQVDLSDRDTAVPDWLPGWIDDMSLRVSDLLPKPVLITDTIQNVVIGCLEIVAISERPRFKETYLSPSERHMYAESLRNTSNALRSVLSQATSTEVPTLTTSTKAAAPPSTLQFMADDFSDSGYSSASSSAENTSLVANEIASHLVSHMFLRRLLSAAQKLEDRDDVLERYLRPCIRHLGQQLGTMASDFEELLVAHELKRHAPFIARALVAHLQRSDIDEDQEVKLQRASRIQRLLDEQTLKHQSGLHSRLHDVISDENTHSARFSYGTDNSDGTRPSKQHDFKRMSLEKVKEFITTGSAFMSFLYSIQYMVYRSPLEIIESEVEHLTQLKEAARRDALEEEVSSYDFAIPLYDEAITFEGHAGHERFRHLLSISGNGEHCYATNCETYLRWAWPATGHYLLEVLSRERRPESSGKRIPK